MTSLTDLYAVILVPLLTEWIKIDEFVMLDSAFCNRHHRTKLLRLNLSYNDVSTSNYTNKTGFIHWLDIRKQKVTSFNLAKYSKKRFSESIINVLQRIDTISHLEMPYCHNLKCIVHSGVAIESLKLLNSEDVNEVNVVELFENKICLSLTKLDLMMCTTLPDIAICMCVSHLPELISLHVAQISESILKLCVNLSELVVTNIAKARDVTMIAEYCHFLTSFRVLSPSTFVTDDDVISLVEGNPGLCDFAIHSAQLTDRSLCKLVETCSPHLTSLDISQCKNITDMTMLAIAKHCHRLVEFRCCGDANITDSGIAAVGKHNPALCTIALDDCNYLTDTALLSVARNCPKLTNLSVVRCDGVTDVAVFDLLKICSDLQFANVFSTRVSATALVRAAQECDKVELLFQHTNAIAAVDLCRKIVRGVKYCKINSYLLQALGPSTLNALVQLSPQLKELVLRGTSWTTLTDVELIALFTSCVGLVGFSLCCFVPEVTAMSVVKLFELCPHIHSIDFNKVTGLTDAIVTQVMTGRYQMRSIQLRHCAALTDSAVTTIAHNCPNLVQFNICGATLITNKSISAIAGHCPKLTNLNLFGCNALTDRVLHCIAQCLLKLTHLTLTNCTRLTRVGIVEFLLACPQLKEFRCTEFKITA